MLYMHYANSVISSLNDVQDHDGKDRCLCIFAHF